MATTSQFATGAGIGFATGGPIGAVVATLSNAIDTIFKIGHGDDKVDQAEEQVLYQFLAPVTIEISGKNPGRTWESVTAAINGIIPSTSQMTQSRAQELIKMGDQIVSSSCDTFAHTGAGYSCTTPRANYRGGGGKDILPMWTLLRAKLSAIQDKSFWDTVVTTEKSFWDTIVDTVTSTLSPITEVINPNDIGENIGPTDQFLPVSTGNAFASITNTPSTFMPASKTIPKEVWFLGFGVLAILVFRILK